MCAPCGASASSVSEYRGINNGLTFLPPSLHLSRPFLLHRVGRDSSKEPLFIARCQGVRSQLCEAPDAPFRRLTPDPLTKTNAGRLDRWTYGDQKITGGETIGMSACRQKASRALPGLAPGLSYACSRSSTVRFQGGKGSENSAQAAGPRASSWSVSRQSCNAS